MSKKNYTRTDLETLPLAALLHLRELRPDLGRIIRLIIENRQQEYQEQNASATASDPSPPPKKPRPPPDNGDMPPGNALFGVGRGRSRKGGAQGDPRRPIFDWLYNHSNGNEHLNLLVDLANGMPHDYDIDLEGDINEGTFANIPIPILIQGVNEVIAGWGGEPYPNTGAGIGREHPIRGRGIMRGGMTDPFTWGYNLGYDVIGPALFGKGSISDLPAHEAIHHGAVQPINQRPNFDLF